MSLEPFYLKPVHTETDWPHIEQAEIDLVMNKSENTWIVDFQYYSSENYLDGEADITIYPKEISVINCFTAGSGYSFFAKSPFIAKEAFEADRTFQHQYQYHKIPWNYGTVEDWVGKLKSIVGKNHWIYVKSAVKRNFLMKHGFMNVMDLDNNGCPSLKDLYRGYNTVKFIKCERHDKVWGLCSLSNVYILRKWFKDTNNYN
jgi:hypothetical protein